MHLKRKVLFSRKNYNLVNILNCPVCGLESTNSRNSTSNPEDKRNFYVDYISEDFRIDLASFNDNLSLVHCGDCYTSYFDKWFDHTTSNKIFNLVYGQHNYGWQNYYNFVNKLLLPNHGNLFEILFREFKIGSYAEYNCPNSGLFFDILNSEYNLDKSFIDKYSQESLKYIKSRQVSKILSSDEAYTKIQSLNLDDLTTLKSERCKIESPIEKHLFYDSSSLCWGYNCVSESVSCKSLGQLMLGFDITNISEINELPKVDCIGLFMVLDHSSKPLELLDKMLDISNIVVIHVHTNSDVTKQHKYSFSKEFAIFLRKMDVYNVDITPIVEKDKNRNKGKTYLDDEMYLLCSKNETSSKIFEKLI